MEAHAGLSTLNHPLAFPNWLRRIVFKHCDRLTRKERPFKTISTETALELVSTDKNPIQIAEEDETNKMLDKALRQLSPEEQRIVRLYYISNHSQQEVADFLGINVHTVTNRLRTARGNLKERLFAMVEENLKENRPSKDPKFVDQVLRLIAPHKDKHSEAIFALFDALGRQDVSTMCRDGRILDSSYDWKTSRIGFVGDKLVTHFGLYDLTLRIGCARVRTAGEQLSYTHPDHGGHGGELMDQTAWAALAAMYDHGYDMAIAMCEPGFAQYGYVPAWHTYDFSVAAADLPNADPPFELRPFDPVYREDLAEIYNRHNKNVTGTTVRPTYLKNKEPSGFKGWLWTDSRGKAKGYVTGGDEGRDVYIDEYAGATDEVVRVLKQLAVSAQQERVRFRGGLPFTSSLGKRLRRCLSLSLDSTKLDRIYFIRIINLQSLFKKLIPELSRRLAEFPLVQWRGDLLIAVEKEQVLLQINGSEINLTVPKETAHAIRGGQEIAKLIFGSDPPDEIAELDNIQLSGDAAQLIKILFPPQYPQFGNQDL